MKTNFRVLGAGVWGLAFSDYLLNLGHNVEIFKRDISLEAERIQQLGLKHVTRNHIKSLDTLSDQKINNEINIIAAGKNYGWPKITYGINYIGTTITKDKALPGLEQPLYYWVPSIAPSSFEYIWSERYDGWSESLLVGSLKYMYLERLELKDGKVTYREKVAKNVGRVRDVKLSPEGLIHIAVENKGIFRLNPKNE